MTLTFDLDLETHGEKKGLVKQSQFTKYGRRRSSSKVVVIEKVVKKRCKQTNKQTNKHTNIPTNINGFRHLIKYGLIFNFFRNQTP